MQKILIIEDDGDIATIERDYLELNDFQVEIAADGIAGLERGLHGAFAWFGEGAPSPWRWPVP